MSAFPAAPQSSFRFPHDFKKLPYHGAKQLQAEKLMKKIKCVLASKWSPLAAVPHCDCPKLLCNSSEFQHLRFYL